MASAVVRGQPSPRIDVKPLATAAAAARASEMRTYLHTAIERADAPKECAHFLDLGHIIIYIYYTYILSSSIIKAIYHMSSGSVIFSLLVLVVNFAFARPTSTLNGNVCSASA